MDKTTLPPPGDALPGRPEPMLIPQRHFVLDAPLRPSVVPPLAVAWFGMGCFWGAERKFWQQRGIYSTAAGYQGGFTPNPTYREVCSGQTGHAEVVQVVWDTRVTSYAELLKLFWENHDPTQGMRQGGDIGTQYRSVLYGSTQAWTVQAMLSRDNYQLALDAAGHGRITTDIAMAPAFYFAEDYHQQYLAKNPDGYCGLGGTGVACPAGLSTEPSSTCNR